MKLRMPAEWEEQSLVQIAWPHIETDWLPYLEAAHRCYCHLAAAISQREPLLIVTPEPDDVRLLLETTEGVVMERVHLLCIDTNDTWARDHAFITCLDEEARSETTQQPCKVLADFCFNGWGQKFASNLDNQINEKTFSWLQKQLGGQVGYMDVRRVVLEGGSIESDGCGTILTTSSCLLAPNRNYFADKEEAEEVLRDTLGAERILWLDHSWLDGDDTDGHIDTVARLCPNNTIAYVKCSDKNDEHFKELSAMEQELHKLRNKDGQPYRLLALPMAPEIHEGDFTDRVAGEEEQRLPATYANFLIVNGAVLMPTYGHPELDNQAKAVLQEAFPDREIVGIDCQILIRQHGSLHCVTMQYPA